MDIKRAPASRRRRYAIMGAGAAALVLAAVGLAQMEPATPTVDRAALWTDTVRHGTMLREVRGPGTLVPEKMRWISSVSAGRVERIDLRPGTEVTPETVLLEIRNPDVQIESLQADRQLTDAAAQLINLRTTLANERLTQRATVAQVQADYLSARRTAENNVVLAEQGLISQPELESSREQAAARAARLEAERERLATIEGAMQQRIGAQSQQVERLREVAAFQRGRVAAMVVRAGVHGVVTELPLEEGQWVNPGQILARIVQPGRLKAVLRVPEAQARDVAIGQVAQVDTRNGVVPGRVARIDPAVENGAVRVDVTLDGELPRGARPDLSVDGTIEVERLDGVLHVGRPASGQAESTVALFRLVPGGSEAVRVPVRLGRSSVNTIEIASGLRAGDVVVLSDLSAYEKADRIRIR